MRALFLIVAGLGGALGGCIPSVSLEERPCPCTDGFQCCNEICIPDVEQCLEVDVDAGSTSGDGGASDDGGAGLEDAGDADAGNPIVDGGCASSNDCENPARERCDSELQMCVPLDVWATVEMSYSSENDETAGRTVERIYFADATLSLDQVHSLLRFQQDLDGLTVWSLYVDNGSVEGEVALQTSGDSTYFYVAENAEEIPARYRGSYFGHNTQQGWINFQELDLDDGGVVHANFDVTLEGGNGSPPATLHMVGEFSTAIPE